ncbi:MAG: hypothetical protein KAS38_13960, partial [Anaerolineales bacterium]|nr:hypothetical protein [Anaerolineales bacterium]
WVAFGTTLLFVTQPLLWGHAFINPKDIPFMSFFLGSVALGLLMYDSFSNAERNPTNQHDRDSGADELLSSTLTHDWKSQKRKIRLIALLIIGLVVGVLLGLLLANFYIRSSIANLIHQSYHAEPASPLGRLFSTLAENKADLPVENYIQKGLKLYQRLLGLYALGSIAALSILALILFPTTRRQLWRRHTRPFIKTTLNHLGNKWVVVAGIMLGLTSSIRILGPAAGLLVAGYFLLKRGRKALSVLLAYFVIAAFVTYITWPALWSNPIGSYLGSISLASDFPWEGKVMFGGIDYSVGDLPRSYLPTLLSLQVTEPAMLMFLVGLAVAAFRSYKKTIDREMVIIFVLWLITPILAVLLLGPTIYDNFRQFLFILPPIFIFAGIGLQALFDKLKNTSLFILLIALLMVPNLYWNVKLHPYQYVYYNSVTGGVKGAFRQYEMDYWATSYREATLYLNQVAPANAKVIVWGPEHIVTNYARQDLRIEEYHKDYLDLPHPADYAILSTRHNKDQTLFPDASQVFSVGRQGALFVVVKQFNNADPPNP